ncbi:MAG TPA: hypothetical protein VF062_05745 [Candidatus Limnocylindrales bacterium]
MDSRSSRKKKRSPVSPYQGATRVVTSPAVQPGRKRRLRSKYVILGSVGTLIAGLCAYGVIRDRDDDDDRTCVNSQNQVVDDDECEDGRSGSRWYYGGSKSSSGHMTGGSYERAGFGGHNTGGGS